jgi:hypothetical protein
MLLPVRCSEPRGPLPDGVRVLLLVGTGMLELLGWRALAERGVLSVDELESVLFLSPGVLVFLGTPEPKPMGVGRRFREPERMLDVRLTPLPRLPSSSELRETLEPWWLGARDPGLEPGWEPGVRELRPIPEDRLP